MAERADVIQRVTAFWFGGPDAHVQVADIPGRHEPGSGEINHPFLFDHLDRLGYQGWIGCEYRPRTGTLDGLGWVKPYLHH